MPVYEYICHSGHVSDKVHSVADCSREHFCNCCGRPAERRLSAPAIIGDYTGYQCPITGDWIEGRKAHNENLAKHECRVLETGEREGMIRHKAASEKALLDAAEDTACRAIMNMPQEKFEILAGELQHGGDADLIRTTLGE